jgi:hypothetical protein
MRKVFEIGGVVAAVILIAFGVATIVMGLDGRSTVRDSIAQEKIVGSPDMTPEAITAAAKEAGLDVATLDIPSMAVADEPIDTGDEARAFAGYMRIHALEASGGLVYAEMGRFVSADDPENPAGTSDEEAALLDEEGNPVPNSARNTWVTETALATALNVSYMAERLSLFSIVTGVALLLAGFGFGILAIGGALRNPDTALGFLHRGEKAPATEGAAHNA